MIKKIIIFKTILLLVFFASTSQAALQWDVAAFIATGTAILVTGLSMIAAAPIVITGTLAVGFHAAVIGLYWNDVQPPLNTGGQAGVKSISVIIDLNTPLITPPEWTQGTVGQEPIPPNTSGVSIKATQLNHNTGQISGTSKADFEAKAMAKLNELNPGFDYIVIFDEETHEIQTLYKDLSFPQSPYADEGTFWNLDSTGCQAGYTLASGGESCSLTDALQVKKPSDEICEYRRANGIFSKSARDPDCDTVSVTGSGTTTLSAVTAGRAVYLATAADDKVSVFTKEFNAQTNQTLTTVANLSSSQIVSLISQTVAAGDTTAVAPNTSGSGTGTTGEGDAKDASLNVQEGGDEATGNDNSPTQGVAAPTDQLQTAFTAIKSWQLPSNTGVCPTATFSLFDRELTLDKHCDIIDANASTISQSMAVFFTITALFIVLGA